jgi:pSer/pThr/pTyr-binding forkhead associated (FHA) protein
MSSNDTLLIYSGETLAREVPLTRSEAVIGRSAECDIVLEPASVSRRHVRLVRRGDTWLAENLSTSAPAQLNGVALTAPAALRPGDRLAVGPFMIALRLAPPPPPAATVITPQAPTLTVSYGGTSAEHILTGASVTIGRSPENSIVIPLGTVSRRHALLQQTPHGYTIIDQNSANGLLRNGAPVAQHPLADGDIIRIGDELGNFVTLAYRTSAAAPAPPIAELKLNAEQQEVTIGRAPGNTLVLDYPDVSARHARLRWQAGSVVLEDLGSTNGTFVRGERIRARAVHPGDLIQIAGRQIVYQADTIRPVEADAVRLDAIQLSTTAARGKITLLHNVSLSIMPRQLVALVGGSGTGKSTLMGALCGIRPASSGQVLVNGVDLYRTYGAYRRSIGYVPQDDIIHTDLPVDRTLHYAARLRLPADTSPDEIERRVGEVLDDVQLGHVRRCRG